MEAAHVWVPACPCAHLRYLRLALRWTRKNCPPLPILRAYNLALPHISRGTEPNIYHHDIMEGRILEASVFPLKHLRDPL